MLRIPVIIDKEPDAYSACDVNELATVNAFVQDVPAFPGDFLDGSSSE